MSVALEKNRKQVLLGVGMWFVIHYLRHLGLVAYVKNGVISCNKAQFFALKSAQFCGCFSEE